MKAIEVYECKGCGSLHKSEREAARCEFDHAREAYANILLDEKNTLSAINYLCGFRWNLKPEHERVTTDNCFIVSHWQCCKKPAYRIVEISSNGMLRLRGMGSWMGYYGSWMDVGNLPSPHDAEELYVYKSNEQ